jgi:hypothetical protein
MLLEHGEIAPARLREFDCVIYGGGIYAGGISGSVLVAKNPVKNLVVFTVGAADPKTTDYTDILENNFPAKIRESYKVFHFRGTLDYKTLNIVHRVMMAMMKQITLGKKTIEELTDEEKLFAETYGGKIDFTDRKTIAPLTEYVRGLF